MSKLSKRISRTEAKKKRADTLAGFFIRSSGLFAILLVVLMVLFLLLESAPLWYGGKGVFLKETKSSTMAEAQILSAGIDEQTRFAFYILSDGSVYTSSFDSLSAHKLPVDTFLPEAVTVLNSGDEFLFADSIGMVGVLQILANGDSVFQKQNLFSVQNKNILWLDGVKLSNGYFVTVLENSTRCTGYLVRMEGDSAERGINSFPFGLNDTISTTHISPAGDYIFFGTTHGELLFYERTDTNVVLLGKTEAFEKDTSRITSIETITGGMSIAAGNEHGLLASWGKVRNYAGRQRFTFAKTHTFESLDSSVQRIVSSPRDKGFLAQSGTQFQYYYLTTERMLFSFRTAEAPVSIRFTKRADEVFVLTENGSLLKYGLQLPHPEISFGTLFGKVWYEGYDKPEYVWQSSGSGEAYEPKLSFVPLIIGSVKGALFGMLFAVPIALLAALYTALFSHRRFRSIVKPAIEMMSAIPSVVIGLVAALWLAPAAEALFPAIVSALFLVPIIVFAGLRLIKIFDKKFRLNDGREIWLIFPLAAAGILAALGIAPSIEQLFMGGDYKTWVQAVFGTAYEQRNAIVTGFALGFAVIPVIFTIAEDALSNVPKSLTSASFALGATRWQTAISVALPASASGLISAVMIGFGRAVGETMIILMVSGNTPVTDLNPFTGMRTIAASLIVEIMEAPYHGTLYRTLFLGAVLLFVFTLIINTAAEVIKQRLRKKTAA